MVKTIGAILIATSLLAFVFGVFIDSAYGSQAQFTGSVISNIMTQPNTAMNLFDFIAGIAFSYSIVSFIMGIMFLMRV